jgi:hypothetical protein
MKEAAIQVFDHDDDGFTIWCNIHLDGFYLNPRPDGQFMLHRSRCDHVGVLQPGSSPTANPKSCCEDRAVFEKSVPATKLLYCNRKCCRLEKPKHAPLAKLNDRAAVLSAIAEFDKIGREAFLEKYGFGQAMSYFVGSCGNSW